MDEKDWALLKRLAEAKERGALVACDGERKAIATRLMRAGLVRWHGDSLGSSFFSITDDGLEYLIRPPIPVE